MEHMEEMKEKKKASTTAASHGIIITSVTAPHDVKWNKQKNIIFFFYYVKLPVQQKVMPYLYCSM